MRPGNARHVEAQPPQRRNEAERYAQHGVALCRLFPELQCARRVATRESASRLEIELQ
jgi:hypothetical protein